MSIVPTTPERNRELAEIHNAARRLGMSEFARRALMYEVTGKESALLMNVAERRAVIDELERTCRQPAPAPLVVSDEEALAILGGY
jgi:phage gp16-like protein